MNKSFITVNIKQRTPEWHEWRKQGIGASDAPIIMGENRFKSLNYLIKEKTSYDLKNNYENNKMALGKFLEPEALDSYIKKTGNYVTPACIQSAQCDWLRASLDGINTYDRKVIEIKCGKSAYEWAYRHHNVPKYYYGQTQHILAITNYESIDFWCYWPGNQEILIKVERNEAYIKLLLEKEYEFWKSIEKSIKGRQSRTYYSSFDYRNKQNNDIEMMSKERNNYQNTYDSSNSKQEVKNNSFDERKDKKINNKTDNFNIGCLFYIIILYFLLRLLFK